MDYVREHSFGGVVIWELGADDGQLMRAIAGAGPLAIREIARRVGRDVKSVHGDVSALLKAGVLDRADDGRIEFPYDEIHVDFVLRGLSAPDIFSAANGRRPSERD